MITETKILGEVIPSGYREVGIAAKLSESVDIGATTIPTSSFTATLLPSANRPITRVYINNEAILRADGTNRSGDWVIVQFTTIYNPNPPVPASLNSRSFRLTQNSAITGNGVTISPPAEPVVTSGVVSPVIDEFIPAAKQVSQSETMNYRYFVPRPVTQNPSTNEKFPLVLALHGHGERGNATGNDNMRQISAYQMGPAWAHPDRQAEHPAYVIAPQCPTMPTNPTNPTSWGQPDRKAALASLINDFVENHNVDPNRIYITGVSMGSMGTWDMYSSYPDLFAAAMTVASGTPSNMGLDPTTVTQALIDKPIWNLISADDSAGLYPSATAALNAFNNWGVTTTTATFAGNLSRAAANQQAANQLAAATLAGSQHLFTTYTSGTTPENGHFSWIPAYQNDTVMDWLFTHSLEAPEPDRVPGTPTGLSASRGNSSASLEWTAPEDEGTSPVDSYRITLTREGFEDIVINTGSDDTSYVAAGLVNGAEYTVTVAATNEVGTGEDSDPVSVTPATTPSQVASPQATPGSDQIAVTWQAPASNGGSAITDYRLRLGVDGVWQPAVELGPGNLQHTFTGLESGPSYTVEIKAINDVGEGAAVILGAYVLPDITPPNTLLLGKAPKSKKVKAGKKVKVKFRFNSTEADSQFECRINFGSKGNWLPCKSGVSYKLKPRKAKYTFQVRAIDKAGNTDSSPAKASFKLKPKK